jgi:hypothetical protein
MSLQLKIEIILLISIVGHRRYSRFAKNVLTTLIKIVIIKKKIDWKAKSDT